MKNSFAVPARQRRDEVRDFFNIRTYDERTKPHDLIL